MVSGLSAMANAVTLGPLRDVRDLQARIGVVPDGAFGPLSQEALFNRLSNRRAPALVEADFARVAAMLGVNPAMIKAVRAVEAPRAPFDELGRPSILYERHIFGRETRGRFNRSHPRLSSSQWAPGTYGPFSAQYGKLAAAVQLHPEAAFKACSWGAFQVLGRNAVPIGYPSAFGMAVMLTESEAAHLDSFARYVIANRLVDELRACRPGDAVSCVPFARGYNGAGYARNSYHVRLAQAAARFAR